MIAHRAICVATLALVLSSCGGDGTAETSTSTSQPAVATSTSTAPLSTTEAPVVTSTTVVVTATTTRATTTTAPAVEGVVIAVTIAGGLITAPSRPEVAIGDTVTIIVTTDVADEVHVHGYDLFLTIAPGTPAELEFAADIPGIFEVELEDSHQLLFDLEVS